MQCFALHNNWIAELGKIQFTELYYLLTCLEKERSYLQRRGEVFVLCESPSSAFDSKGLLTNALKATILQKERCCILVGSVEPTVMLLLLHRESWLVLRLTGVVTPVGLAVSHPGSGHNRGLATARHSTCGAVHHGTGDAVAGPAAVAAGHPTALFTA